MLGVGSEFITDVGLGSEFIANVGVDSRIIDEVGLESGINANAKVDLERVADVGMRSEFIKEDVKVGCPINEDARVGSESVTTTGVGATI